MQQRGQHIQREAGERKKVWHSWDQRTEQSSWSTLDKRDGVSESGPGQIPEALKAGLVVLRMVGSHGMFVSREGMWPGPLWEAHPGGQNGGREGRASTYPDPPLNLTGAPRAGHTPDLGANPAAPGRDGGSSWGLLKPQKPKKGREGACQRPSTSGETQSSLQAQAKPSVSWARERLSSSSPAHGNGGGLRRGGEIAKVTQRRRINSVSPELAHLHLFQAAEAPSLQGI